ncbi:hypothetical protein ACFYM2_01360 [Streptomyces sp. NPDC006711]|uniref:hypothetical protein n=1 Tax=Streptomyces sp. NPDC006711 TaxID=3364762 RepID=UPI0036BA78F4
MTSQFGFTVRREGQRRGQGQGKPADEGVPGLEGAKNIVLMHGIDIDADCRTGISGRRAYRTSGTRGLLVFGLTEQRESALGSRFPMSWTSRARTQPTPVRAESRCEPVEH